MAGEAVAVSMAISAAGKRNPVRRRREVPMRGLDEAR